MKGFSKSAPTSAKSHPINLIELNVINRFRLKCGEKRSVIFFRIEKKNRTSPSTARTFLANSITHVDLKLLHYIRVFMKKKRKRNDKGERMPI